MTSCPSCGEHDLMSEADGRLLCVGCDRHLASLLWAGGAEADRKRVQAEAQAERQERQTLWSYASA